MPKDKVKGDPKLVSKCGLYCGSCKKFKSEKCPGCEGNEKASWCKVRTCCLEKNIPTCVQCNEFDDWKECKKANNFMSGIFSFFYNSDHDANKRMIAKDGLKKYANHMAREDLVSMKKR